MRNDEHEKFMREADRAAWFNQSRKFKTGGPFGACIVKRGKLIVTSTNTVLIDKDPTCHAEINAIRAACDILKTHDLKGCTLYTTCYPCPMCLSAAIWANIDTIYYGNTKEDAANIGFRDDKIYKVLQDPDSSPDITLKQLDRNTTIKLFDEFNSYTDKDIRY